MWDDKNNRPCSPIMTQKLTTDMISMKAGASQPFLAPVPWRTQVPSRWSEYPTFLRLVS